MPYIEQASRLAARHHIPAADAGELNYQITQLIEEYRTTRGDRYATFNDVLGALEGAKLEFYRRVVAPYENSKREQNGDVYRPVELP